MRARLKLVILCCATVVSVGCWPPPTSPTRTTEELPPPPRPSATTVSVNLSGAVFSTQQESLWCWAASIANLFAYHGHPVSQARIVSEVYGLPVNMRSGDYSNLARLLHRPWRDDRGQAFTVTLTSALDILNGVNRITNDDIRDALRANMPLVVGTTQHAMLVVGMTYTEVDGRVADVQAVRVFDPWPGMGLRTLSRAEMTSTTLGGSLMFIALAQVSR